MQVLFYELPEHAQSKGDGLYSYMIDLLAMHYEKRTYLSLVCSDKEQAEEMDELMWQLPADKFIAHNLQGEGPINGSPVEITWLNSKVGHKVRNKKLVINVSGQFLSDFNEYQQIIDFVPNETKQKELARERYKQYKQAGCRMSFVNAN